MAKLKCDNLSVSFLNQPILKNIMLDFETHKITALIGPSGCGKTTLLKCFNRINDLSDGFRESGAIYLEDVPIRKLPVQQLRRKIGMVFQRPTPFSMSIYQNVAFGPRANGIKKKSELDEIVEKSLQDAFLWQEVKDRLGDSARGLSGGQQQRLCIARALAVSPEVLLLDEPTSALDPISTEHIEQLLLTLQDKLTMVLVSHDLRQVRKISSRTVYMERGTVVETGKTQEMFLHPINSKTAMYIKQ